MQRLGGFIEANLGAIMGNFLFGVFLGSTATIGFLFGLPIDIRHIAFASANLAHGLFNISASQWDWQIVFVSILGVGLIGMVNLMVSFSLALFVALRSKEVKFLEWSRLTKQLFSHMLTHPSDFFWPRDKPMKYARIDSQGHMIFDDTSAQKGTQAIPSNYVVRRLSDVKILPKSKQKSMHNEQAITDIDYDNNISNGDTDAALKSRETHSTTNHISTNKTIELDDGLIDEELNSVPYSSDIQYDKSYEAFHKDNEVTEHYESNNSNPDSKAAGDAKTALPKPKKPPNLPS